MKRNRNTLEQIETLDLTPMLDVVFILLIFFIATASFMNYKSLKRKCSTSNRFSF